MAASSVHSTERERPLILVVEDQEELRRLYVEQLALGGFDHLEPGQCEVFNVEAAQLLLILDHEYQRAIAT